MATCNIHTDQGMKRVQLYASFDYEIGGHTFPMMVTANYKANGCNVTDARTRRKVISIQYGGGDFVKAAEAALYALIVRVGVDEFIKVMKNA